MWHRIVNVLWTDGGWRSVYVMLCDAKSKPLKTLGLSLVCSCPLIKCSKMASYLPLIKASPAWLWGNSEECKFLFHHLYKLNTDLLHAPSHSLWSTRHIMSSALSKPTCLFWVFTFRTPFSGQQTCICWELSLLDLERMIPTLRSYGFLRTFCPNCLHRHGLGKAMFLHHNKQRARFMSKVLEEWATFEKRLEWGFYCKWIELGNFISVSKNKFSTAALHWD